MNKLIVVNRPEEWDLGLKNVQAISPTEYLNNPQFGGMRNVRVFNLSYDYSYQTRGYYVSLLAEARGHKPLPGVKSLIDMRGKTMVRVVSDELEGLIQKSLKSIKSDEFVLSIYFGQNVAKHYHKLCAELHKYFQAPFIRAKFSKKESGWTMQTIKPISIKDIREDHLPFVKEFAMQYFAKSRYEGPRSSKLQYNMAILHDPHDDAPPSNMKALLKFVEVAERMGIDAELITSEDYNRLPTFDALFIRQNTEVLNATYRFATRALAEEIALIDYPESILKCCNKVYMAELLQTYHLPAPKSLIVQKENRKKVGELLGFPCVIKSPDSTFSFGVKKANNEEELDNILTKMFKESDLLIAQEYCFTDYDWRIGILDEKPLYACKYYMAKGHWQIYNWSAKDVYDQDGMFDTFPLEEVPTAVMDVAIKVTKKLGKGLFGVDVKEIDGKPLVIEINDCPNLDFGIEDQVLGDGLYEAILGAFKKRLDKKYMVDVK